MRHGATRLQNCLRLQRLGVLTRIDYPLVRSKGALGRAGSTMDAERWKVHASYRQNA
jgi:hypothetical protein